VLHKWKLFWAALEEITLSTLTDYVVGALSVPFQLLPTVNPRLLPPGLFYLASFPSFQDKQLKENVP
jgi:hypothetical protein